MQGYDNVRYKIIYRTIYIFPENTKDNRGFNFWASDGLWQNKGYCQSDYVIEYSNSQLILFILLKIIWVYFFVF